jgi:hypothetical protein
VAPHNPAAATAEFLGVATIVNVPSPVHVFPVTVIALKVGSVIAAPFVAPSQAITPVDLSELASPLKAATFAFVLADESDAKTTDERIPIIAITTSNSINVKPLLFFILKYINLINKTNN